MMLLHLLWPFYDVVMKATQGQAGYWQYMRWDTGLGARYLLELSSLNHCLEVFHVRNRVGRST